ncbi:MAG: ribonuclease H-like domain-containing protein [Candidatus Cloacimonadales bacterium]
MINLEELLGAALPKAPPTRSRKNCQVEQILAGNYLAKDLFCTVKDYAWQEKSGNFALQKFQQSSLLCAWAGIPAQHQLQDLLFIDTETTGLAGGTGTYAFLVGLGYFTASGFRVEQYFMNNLSAEKSLLQQIISLLSPRKILVSYNGKSFDLNLLQTRLIANNLDYCLKDLGHIDLLHLVRRFWKGSFGSCTLQNIEKFVLRNFRNFADEIPGAAIPQVYFDYLELGVVDKLENVFLHNQADIFNLAILLRVINSVLTKEISWQQLLINPLGLARFYNDFGQQQAALELLQANTVESDCRKYLSFIYKQNLAWEAAIKLWQEAITFDEIYAYRELAKYYEHRAADFQQALTYTKSALELVSSGYWINPELLEEFSHRQERLQRKLAGKAATDNKLDDDAADEA